MSFLTKHLEEVGETYFEHMWKALSFAFSMVLGGFACFVHALFPFFFTWTGSSAVRKLYDKMVVNRKKVAPHHVSCCDGSANQNKRGSKSPLSGYHSPPPQPPTNGKPRC